MQLLAQSAWVACEGALPLQEGLDPQEYVAIPRSALLGLTAALITPEVPQPIEPESTKGGD